MTFILYIDKSMFGTLGHTACRFVQVSHPSVRKRFTYSTSFLFSTAIVQFLNKRLGRKGYMLKQITHTPEIPFCTRSYSIIVYRDIP